MVRGQAAGDRGETSAQGRDSQARSVPSAAALERFEAKRDGLRNRGQRLEAVNRAKIQKVVQVGGVGPGGVGGVVGGGEIVVRREPSNRSHSFSLCSLGRRRA